MDKTMSKEKQPIEENIFGAAKKFTDAFFDGLKQNAINQALDRAKENKFPPEVIDAMQRIEKERDTLNKLIRKYFLFHYSNQYLKNEFPQEHKY
jgi:hypothetical protein